MVKHYDTPTLLAPMVQAQQASAPPTPAAGYNTGIYFKTDGLPYYRTPAGTEVPLGRATPSKHPNPGFDGTYTSTAHGLKPPSWDDFWMAAGVVANTYDTTDTMSGGGSYKIVQPATGATVATRVQNLDAFGVLPGDEATVSVWAKTDLPSPTLQISLNTGATAAAAAPFGAGTVQGRDFVISSSWALYTASFTIPTAETFARIGFVGSAIGAGSWWLDESGSSTVSPPPPSGLVPTSAILPFAGSSIPTSSGWLLCNGAAVSRTTYATLFSVISTAYGVGDGSTTFNVPDLRGRSPSGYDSTQTEFNTLGKTGGEKAHVLTSTEVPQMAINSADGYPIFSGLGGGQAGYYLNNANNNGNPAGGPLGRAYLPGGGAGHNNLPPYVSTNYIIKT